MKRSVLALGALAALGGPAAAAPSNTLQDIYAELHQCVTRIALKAGTDVTLQFMLNRKGGLIGKPRLTHAIWPPDADPREAAAAIASGFDRCLPLEITDALGGAVAGRLIFYRLRATPKEQKA
jgi:hypothetical protein